MRVLIYEPDYPGHRLAHVRLQLEGLSTLGVEIVLATRPASAKSKEYAHFIAPFAAHFRLDDWIPPKQEKGVFAAAADRARELHESIRRASPDHVIVPYADGTSQAITLARLRGQRIIPKGVTSEALFFRGGIAYHPEGLKARIAARLSWELNARCPYTVHHHLDPVVLEWLRRSSPSQHRRWSLMPEPVEPTIGVGREEARRRLGLPVDGRIIGTTGFLETRKGVDLLARAFINARTAPNDRLLLAGHLHEDLKPVLNELDAHIKSGRILVIGRFLTDEELLLAVEAMDVVAPVYPRHVGSASIVIRAAAAGRPNLGSDWGWVGENIRRFSLGWTVDVPNQAALTAAVAHSLENAHSWQPNEACRRYLRFHTTDNFKACYTNFTRSRLGLAPSEATVTWDWVSSAALP